MPFALWAWRSDAGQIALLSKGSQAPLVLFHTFFINHTVVSNAFLKGLCAQRVVKALPTHLFEFEVFKVIHATVFAVFDLGTTPPSHPVALPPA